MVAENFQNIAKDKLILKTMNKFKHKTKEIHTKTCHHLLLWKIKDISRYDTLPVWKTINDRFFQQKLQRPEGSGSTPFKS